MPRSRRVATNFSALKMNKIVCDRRGALLTKTLKLVKDEPRGLLAVYQKTGVPFYWLRKFAAGKIPNPGVNRVEFLYERLSGKKVLS